MCLYLLTNTHMMIASNFFDMANSSKVYLIDRKRFIWGNVKPDCVPKYKLMKHYYDESIDMILDKIRMISSLSISDVFYNYGKNKFSEELGIICHFLCDYFCVPHSYRWEFKSYMKKHIFYEKALSKISKAYKPKAYCTTKVTIDNVEKFIVNAQARYRKRFGFKNDLDYSYFVCNSIINLILNEVVKNEYSVMKRAV